MKKINATGFFAGGLIALILGAVIYLFVNIWVGLILALAAEIVFTMPKTLLQNAVKLDNQVLIDYITGTLGGTIGEEYADPYGQGRITAVEEAP